MEWLALLIPFFTAIVLFLFFSHKTVWWEFTIPFGLSLILILVLKFGAEISQTTDIEYWGGFVTEAEYYEEWDEEVPCTHAKYRTVTDKDGNSHEEFDGYEHIYDVSYHSPYWQLTESNGFVIDVDKDQFVYLCNKFQNKTKVDLNRDYHSIDGDKFVTTWQGQSDKIEPAVTSHLYTNKVQAANSVFNFRNIKKDEIKKFGLFEYPEIYDYYKCDSIFGDAGPTHIRANKALNILNAKMGKSKEVRMMILVFKNQPLEAGILQESYWKRGNKNEFIITIGVDSDYNIKWAHTFSWTESEILITEANKFVREQKSLNLEEIVKWMGQNVKDKFVRRHFSTFDYLRVDIPGWAMTLIFILTLLSNVGISVWIVKNEYQEKGRI